MSERQPRMTQRASRQPPGAHGPATAGVAALEHQIVRDCFEDLRYVVTSQANAAVAAAALAQVGLTRADLRAADLPAGPSSPAVTFQALYRALSWVHHEAGLPLVALHFGLRRGLADHGVFDSAIHTPAPFERHLKLVARYFTTVWGHATLSVTVTRRQVIARYRLVPGQLEDPSPVLLAMTASSVAFHRQALPDEDLSACEMHYSFPAPECAAAIRDVLGCQVMFGQRHDEFRLPRDRLATRLGHGTSGEATALVEAYRLWRTTGGVGGWRGRVQQALLGDDGQFFSEHEVALRLDLTPRTLRRRLAAEGCSFRTVLNATRLELARGSLQDPALSVADIAAQLGYAHATSLRRAYKAYFGHAPRDRVPPSGVTP